MIGKLLGKVVKYLAPILAQAAADALRNEFEDRRRKKDKPPR